tara:strand:+ start:121 stop:915 length:795 start_codon:yes stop_codon:yes gene_type:complete
MAEDQIKKSIESSFEKKHTFPSETIDLPSKGKVYPKNSPLSDGTIELKYMTTKEEDILTSQNLIKKGVVVDKLLNSLIVTPGVTTDDLIIGDKNAIMVAARILAYGGDYEVEVMNPNDNSKFNHKFDLTALEFKNPVEGVDYSENNFTLDLPVSKVTITFKLLDGKDERNIASQLKGLQKVGTPGEVSTRLKNVITSVNGDDSKQTISTFVENMLSKESLLLRDEISRLNPDIELSQDVELPSGETVSLAIPMTVEFFWPKAGA